MQEQREAKPKSSMVTPVIQVQETDFEPGSLYAELASANRKTGAIAIFTGLVRDLNLAKDVQNLYLEHYPGMTEGVLKTIADDAIARYDLHALTVIHRVGCLQPGDNIVFVGCSTMHREDAFSACQFVMDRLKTEAPFWKKEKTRDGHVWLETQEKDIQLRQRWEDSSSSK